MTHGVSTIHARLNRMALSSDVGRRITYVCASTLAYVLFAGTILSLYLGVPESEYATVVLYSLGIATIARAIVEVIYVLYKRPRPSSSDRIEPLFINSNPSFPSGHATFFSSLAATLALLGAPFSLAFAVATLIMCIARVVAGVHFFSDIVAGCILGVGTTFVLFMLLGIY